jgi:hypothetical protein
MGWAISEQVICLKFLGSLPRTGHCAIAQARERAVEDVEDVEDVWYTYIHIYIYIYIYMQYIYMHICF